MPIIEYRAPVKVLLAVRGHPFDRNALDALFQSLPGISATVVDQPAAAQLMNPEGMRPYDALLLYDMPGLDFEATVDKPAYIDPGEAFKRGFEALLEEGKGIVALHHSLAGWPAWPAYADYLGGTFLYRPGRLRGENRPDSGYRHQVEYQAEVLAPEHPVMAGIPGTFAMRDELYLGEVFESEVTPLLRSSHRFTRDNFHSATAAMNGVMYSNEGWSHADGSSLIGWCKRAINSPLVYLQPGDDQQTYDNPIYRRLIENAIRWVISPAARA
ncbi:ThuA domain-containing protein [Hydrocarboniphaga sp.]|uniref:ThuA domain-containing protein n=1 Tax=Hydrocarboniphaga sp. TaxID=2033016 RepID=UPI003D13EBCE